jgi:hypothetical protein
VREPLVVSARGNLEDATHRLHAVTASIGLDELIRGADSLRAQPALVAAYFAVIEVSVAVASAPVTNDRVVGVFILDTEPLSREPFMDRVAVASAPRYANHHLRAQRGLFVHLRQANRTFVKEGRWPGLEDVVGSVDESEVLDIVTLPASEADAVLRLLRRYEVTRHHLMPTLGNAARAVLYECALFRPPSKS